MMLVLRSSKRSTIFTHAQPLNCNYIDLYDVALTLFLFRTLIRTLIPAVDQKSMAKRTHAVITRLWSTVY